ncbi:nucleoside monophosphate kinase [Candidatus Woesebacteria bacterium]|nr:nucleoside monophosphate kinase [Candidatus Woesebacteria bacterium]
MNIILLGIQGAGKSTQGNLLSKQLKIPYLSTGHIFRDIAQEKTTLGRMVKELVNSGSLVPDDKTIEIVNNYLGRPEYTNGFILDGYPRTPAQAHACTFPISKVVYLELDEKESLWRLAMRKEARDDNTVQAVQRRIKQFHAHTAPVLEHYAHKDLLVTVDAKLKVKKVNEEILKSLGKQYIANRLEAWEQKKHTIIALVGLSGSGKTEAVQYLAKAHKLPIISFSSVINEYIDTHKLEHSEDVHRKLRKEFREKHGMASMAVLRRDEIAKRIDTEKSIIIEGLYSWEEYLYLQKEFPHARVVLVAVWARKELRWDRASKRKYRKNLFGAERDIHELTETNKGPAIAFADHLIINNFSLHEFQDKLDEVYRSIIFSE